jgi:hypothetical protein
MKTDGVPALIQIEKEDLKRLIAEVRETVAGLIQLPAEKKVSFGTASLWNVQRNARSANDIMNRR